MLLGLSHKKLYTCVKNNKHVSKNFNKHCHKLRFDIAYCWPVLWGLSRTCGGSWGAFTNMWNLSQTWSPKNKATTARSLTYAPVCALRLPLIRFPQPHTQLIIAPNTQDFLCKLIGFLVIRHIMRICAAMEPNILRRSRWVGFLDSDKWLGHCGQSLVMVPDTLMMGPGCKWSLRWLFTGPP